LLPLPRFPQAADQVRGLGRQLRDLQYQPERFVATSADVAQLLHAKKDWIARPGATHADRVRRFHAIRAINATLHSHVGIESDKTRSALAHLLYEGECDSVAARRDYAFCLYPEPMLRDFFTHVLPVSLHSF